VQAFLSYNSLDRDIVRRVGAQMKLAGADVWFDEWEIAPGDSIPGKISEGLGSVDTFVLIWSESAEKSRWVKAELEGTLMEAVEDGSIRLIPTILDDTRLPRLLRQLKWVDLRDGDDSRAVNEIMGFATDQQRLLAIQAYLDEAGIEVAYFEGYGPVVCCPKCGAGLEHLHGWSQVDERRDDTYGGVRCTKCRFSDGAEIG
jgi:hypothetical protein